MTFKCDSSLIHVKFVYFLSLAGAASFFPFSAVFAKYLGLSPFEISLSLCFSWLISAPLRFLIGYIADKTEKRVLVFFISTIFSCLSNICIYFIPKSRDPSMESLTNSFSGDFQILLNLIFKNLSSNPLEGELNPHFIITCSDSSSKEHEFDILLSNFSNLSLHFYPLQNFTSCYLTNLKSTKSNFSNSFFLFSTFLFFNQAFFSPLMNIVDGITYTTLGKKNKTKDYGKSRLFGSLGFSLMALLTGSLMELIRNCGFRGRLIFLICFISFVLNNVISSIILLLKKNELESFEDTKDLENSEREVNKKTLEWEKTTSFRSIISSFTMIIITISGVVAGILAGCLENFFFYFLDSLDGNKKSVMGVSLALAALAEMLIIYYSSKIIKKFGKENTLYFVFFTFSLRFLGNSFITNPWFGVGTEFLNCICFGLFFPLMTNWANSLTPPHFQSSIQCYFGAFYFSIGRALGCLVTGALYSKISPRFTFLFFFFISLFYMFTAILILNIAKKCSKKRCHSDLDNPFV